MGNLTTFSRVRVKKKGVSKEYSLRKGLGFQALSAKEETEIEYDCRKADCGICIMRVLSGSENLSPATGEEADFLRAMHADPNERLACQCRILGDVEVVIEF